MPKQHLLIVSHQFGASGHTGGFRWFYLMRHLHSYGWTCDVLTSDGAYAWVEGDVPPGVTLHPVKTVAIGQRILRWKQYLSTKLSSSTADAAAPAPADESTSDDSRQQNFIASLRKNINQSIELLENYIWSRRAVRQARRLIATTDYDAIIATSPVYMTQHVAATLAAESGVPYIADFREVWYYGREADIHHIATAARRQIWKYLEQQTMQHATAAININRKATRVSAESLQTQTGQKLPRYCVPNGADARSSIQPPDKNCFVIAYTGHLYDGTPLAPLFEAVAQLITEHDLTPAQLQLVFMGPHRHLNGEPITATAARHHIAGYITHHIGRHPKSEADALLQRAALMIVFEHAHSVAVPSKLYHYAQVRGDILLIGQPDSALAEEGALLDLSIVRPDDTDGLFERIAYTFQRWQGEQPLPPVDSNGELQWQHRAADMHRVLGDILNSPADSASGAQSAEHMQAQDNITI